MDGREEQTYIYGYEKKVLTGIYIPYEICHFQFLKWEEKIFLSILNCDLDTYEKPIFFAKLLNVKKAKILKIIKRLKKFNLIEQGFDGDGEPTITVNLEIIRKLSGNINFGYCGLSKTKKKKGSKK